RIQKMAKINHILAKTQLYLTFQYAIFKVSRRFVTKISERRMSMKQLTLRKLFSLSLVFALVFMNYSPMMANAENKESADDLFISEYIEGSSYNKAIEIYNGTGSSVNLSDYQLELYSNGSDNPTQSLTLSGSLANDE